ncbi:sulfotransferase family 2 domain-containing protein [Rhizobium sp. PAMB 3182]
MRVPRNPIEAVFPNAGLKMIFLHTPKCGGSYVNDAFGKRFKNCPTIKWKEAKGHKTYLEYKNIFYNRGQNIHDYIIFTVIRNPWDWHLSWYNYISKDIGGKKSGMLLEHEQIKDLTFSDYLKWLEDQNLPRSKDDFTRRQISDWLTDEEGHLAVKHILRQENLEQDLLEFKAMFRLRISIKLGRRINTSRDASDYRFSYSSSEADTIRRRHARDIALFGYSFE